MENRCEECGSMLLLNEEMDSVLKRWDPTNSELMYQVLKSFLSKFQRAKEEIRNLKDELNLVSKQRDEFLADASKREEERAEIKRTLSHSWRMDMHGIEVWQKKTGNNLTWPDKTNLIEWFCNERVELMFEREALKEENDHLKGELDLSTQELESIAKESLEEPPPTHWAPLPEQQPKENE